MLLALASMHTSVPVERLIRSRPFEQVVDVLRDFDYIKSRLESGDRFHDGVRLVALTKKRNTNDGTRLKSAERILSRMRNFPTFFGIDQPQRRHWVDYFSNRNAIYCDFT